MKIVFFAALADVFGSEIEIKIAKEQLSVADIILHLQQLKPEVSQLLNSSRIAINQEFATKDQRIDPKDEIAVLPPSSGG